MSQPAAVITLPTVTAVSTVLTLSTTTLTTSTTSLITQRFVSSETITNTITATITAVPEGTIPVQTGVLLGLIGAIIVLIGLIVLVYKKTKERTIEAIERECGKKELQKKTGGQIILDA